MMPTGAAGSLLSRLKSTPKDTIPASKSPRRQHSSRFQLPHGQAETPFEKLPAFKGTLSNCCDTTANLL